jgi:Domain of unknown function (DUF4157)
MSAGTEHAATNPSPIREKPQASPAPEGKQRAHDGGGHGGIGARMHEIVGVSAAQESPRQELNRIFRSAEFAHTVNDEQKTHALQTLQRSYGNRYVQRVLESDAPQSEVNGRHPSARRGQMMRELLQAKTIQPRLEVSSPGDALEREADRMADQVMSMPAPGKQTPARTSGELKRQVETGAQPHENSTRILRAPSEPGGPPPVSSKLERNLGARRGGGQPLAGATRDFFEPRFGQDLSGVRVHHDGEAADAAQEINAQAFTHGRDIYFGAGKYQPQSQTGRRLLAHELAHTVQQGQSGNPAQRMSRTESSDLIQRTNGRPAAQPSIVIPVLNIPEFKMRNTPGLNRATLFTSRPGQYFRAASYVRDPSSTLQAAVWEESINPGTIEGKLRAAPFNMRDNVTYMVRARGQGSDYDKIGGPRELARGLRRPFWRPTSVEFEEHQVDHIVELQIAGFPRQTWADTIANYQLLNKTANESSGATIRRQITAAIDAYRTNPPAGSPLPTPRPTTEAIKQSYDVVFQSFNPNPGLNPGGNISTWSRDEVLEGKHIDDLGAKNRSARRIYLYDFSDPVPAGDFYTDLPNANDVASLIGASSRLVIYMGSAGGSRKPAVGWPAANPNADVSRGLLPSDRLIRGGFAVQNINFNRSGAGAWAAVLRGEVFRDQSQLCGAADRNYPWHVRRMPGTAFAGYLDYAELLGFLRDRMTFHSLSPVRIGGVEVDEQKGLIAVGKIQCTLPLLRGAEIDLVLEGNDLRAEKVFDLGDFKVPRPLEIRSSSMALSIGTQSGLRARGRVDFAIQNLAEGYLEGGAGTSQGLYLAGGLTFDRSTFHGHVDLRYQDRELSGTGVVTVPSGKIAGIRTATLNVRYERGQLSANGTADFTIQGLRQATLGFSQTESEGTVITAGVELGTLPGIRSGSVSARLAKPTGATAWELSGRGTAVPNIPGVASTLTVAYDRGIFTAEARASYARGMLSGSILVGATNRPIDPEGRPVEGAEPARTITPYGQGQLTVRIAPWLQGTIGVRILPNGEIEVSGAIGLPSSVNIFPARPPLVKNIFSINIDIPIVGLAVAGQRIGIFATIGGGLEANAGIGAGELRALGLTITYNPAHEDQTHVTGHAQLYIPAQAGLRLFVHGGLGVGIPLVSATATLEVGGSLGLEGAVTADVNVDWMAGRGLTIDASAAIYAQPKFKFDVTGRVLVELDLLLTTIELYSKRWRLASFEYGSDLRFGVRFPIRYQEGRPFDISLSDMQFEYPHINPMDLLTGLISRI